MKLVKKIFLIFFVFFQFILFAEIFLHILLGKDRYLHEFKMESVLYKYRRSWYGDAFANTNCSISEELISHPHLAFISKSSDFCNIPVTDSGTYGKRNLKSTPVEREQEFSILLIGGSTASHLGILEEKNPLEIELNAKYVPPMGKKRFTVYNGSHPAWKMPSTTIMGMMNQKYFDSIIYLDGFNEFTSIFFEKNLWNPSEYVYSIAAEKNLSKVGLISFSRKILTSLYFHFYISRELRLVNVLLKILLLKSQELKVHYIPYGNGNAIEDLATEYLNHVQKNLTHKNSLVFFQPTALTGKSLSQEELDGCEYLCKKEYMALYEEYISLVNKKSNELKLKNFYTLSNIFRKNKETIYLDSVHLKNGTKDLGMRILASQMVLDISKSLRLKKK